MLNVPSDQGGRALRRYMHGFSYLARQLVLTSDTMWGFCGPTYNRLAETECQKICHSALEAQLSKSKTSSPKCAESVAGSGGVWAHTLVSVVLAMMRGQLYGMNNVVDLLLTTWDPLAPHGCFLTWTHFASSRVQMAGSLHLQAVPSRSKLGQSR